MSIFTVGIIGLEKKIIYQKRTSLLFTLEVNNIDLEYHCRSGYCGTCRIELIQGKICYLIKQPMAALSKDREILPCCCYPNGNIIIKI